MLLIIVRNSNCNPHWPLYLFYFWCCLKFDNHWTRYIHQSSFKLTAKCKCCYYSRLSTFKNVCSTFFIWPQLEIVFSFWHIICFIFWQIYWPFIRPVCYSINHMFTFSVVWPYFCLFFFVYFYFWFKTFAVLSNLISLPCSANHTMGYDSLWHRGALPARWPAPREPAEPIQRVWQRYGTQRYRARCQRTMAQYATGEFDCHTIAFKLH